MAKKTRINWAKNPHFGVLVTAVCDYNSHCRFCQANGVKPLSISKFWRNNIKGNGPIHLPLRTLSGYIKKKNASTRRRLGSQVGPKSEASRRRMQYGQEQQRKRQLEIDNIINQLLGNHLPSPPPMNAAGVPLQLPTIEPQPEVEERQHQQEDNGGGVSRLNQQYKQMSIDFKNLPRRSPAEKREWQYQMATKLPRLCDIVGGDKDFLDKEIELLRQCGSTFGSAEVFYVAPQRNEIGQAGGIRTMNRRAKLERKIDHFQRIQTRQTLVLRSGVGRPALMVAADYLLKRFDQDLVGNGLQPSDLRQRLREYNHLRSEELKKMNNDQDVSSEDASYDSNDLGVKELDISVEESALLRREILDEMVLEDDDVSYDDVDLPQRQTLDQMVLEGDDTSYVDIDSSGTHKYKSRWQWPLHQTVLEGSDGSYVGVDSGNMWERRWALDSNTA